MRQYLNNPIANCISSINLGYAAKQLFIELPVSRQLHSLLTTFVALGAIQSFTLKNSTHGTGRPSVGQPHARQQAFCPSGLSQGSARVGVQKFFMEQPRAVGALPSCGKGYTFVVYLKYAEYTPVFSSIRNYWLSRRKIVVPYSSLQVSRVQNTKQVFVL